MGLVQSPKINLRLLQNLLFFMRFVLYIKSVATADLIHNKKSTMRFLFLIFQLLEVEI